MKNQVILSFSSAILASSYDEVQSILFYNENQSPYRIRIRNAITENGKPELIINKDFLTVRLEKEIFQETMFIFGTNQTKKLLGIIILKKENQIIEIVHIALSPDCKNIRSENNLTILEESIAMIPKMFNRMNDIKAIKIGYKSQLIRIK